MRVQALDLVGRSSFAFSATTSDARGIFTLRGVHTSGMTLALSAPGYYEVRRTAVERQTPLDVTLAPSGFTMGRVLDREGRAQRGFVQPVYEAESVCAEGVETDAAGRFRIPITLRARYRLVARGAAMPFDSLSPILEGPADDVTVRPVDSSLPVTLCPVADEDDTPIPRFQVEWSSADANDAPTTVALHASSSPRLECVAGVAELRVHPSHRSVVLVRAPGRVLAAVALTAEDAFSSVTVRLRRECALAGVVRDHAGKPIPGARLYALRGTGISNYGPMPADAPRTDAQGRFQIGGLGPGVHRVHVIAPGIASPQTFHVELDTAGKRDVEFELPPACRLVGTLRHKGRIPRGTWAWLVESEIPTRAKKSPLTAPSDLRAPVEDGTFEFEHIEAGSYRLLLLLPLAERVGGQRRIDLGAVELEGDLQSVFDPALEFGRVSGRVQLGAHAEFAPRLAVLALDEEGPPPGFTFDQVAAGGCARRGRAICLHRTRRQLPPRARGLGGGPAPVRHARGDGGGRRYAPGRDARGSRSRAAPRPRPSAAGAR